MSPFLEFCEDPERQRWVRWTPESAEDAALRRAVEAFQPLDNDAAKHAGKRNAHFLQKEALASHPTMVTHILVEEGRVEGFFALCSGTAWLTEPESREVREHDEVLEIPRLQPVAHIAWIARHKDSRIGGVDLLAQAAALALEVIDKGQGQLALSLNAFDEPTAEMWIRDYKFTRSPLKGQICLWRSLKEGPGVPD